MVKKSLSLAALIIGTVIGAGFASGKELASFFGDKISLGIPIICGILVFLFCVLFLFVGKKAGCSTISEVNKKMLGKFSLPADIFLLTNNFVALGAMISASDSLFLACIPVPKIGGACVAAVTFFLLRFNKNSFSRANNYLVPVIFFIVVIMGIFFHTPAKIPLKISGIFSSIVYISLNAMLLASSLFLAREKDNRVIFLGSFLGGVLFCALMIFVTLTLNSGNFSAYNLPVLEAAKLFSPLMFFLEILTIFFSILTTSISASAAISSELFLFVKSKNFSLIITILGALILGQFGFEFILSRLYPVIGVLGACYAVVGITFMLRPTVLGSAAVQPFKQRNSKIHKGCEGAQNNGGSHY